MPNYYINGIDQSPAFKVCPIGTSTEIKRFEFPVCNIEGINYKPEREIDVTEYLCGKTGTEVLGYKHNWVFDYKEFMYSEHILNLFCELMYFYDNTDLFDVYVKPLADSKDIPSNWYKSVCMNTDFVLNLIYEGSHTKGISGLELMIRSVERYAKFWEGWILINPNEPRQVIGYETNEGQIQLN